MTQISKIPNSMLSQVMTSTTDTTTPDALLRRGDFGLGSTLGVFISNANTALAAGIYATPSEWVGSPFAGATASNQGTLVNIVWNENYSTQTFIPINTALSQRIRQKDNGVWGAWVNSYANNNIVGTVSQSAGVPTGAIIQRGSNANGEFTRWADGTMICWHSAPPTASNVPNISLGSIFVTENNTWSYPSSFSGTFPVSFFANEVTGAGTTWCGIGNNAVTTTNASYKGFKATSSSVQMQISLTVIGRWF